MSKRTAHVRWLINTGRHTHMKDRELFDLRNEIAARGKKFSGICVTIFVIIELLIYLIFGSGATQYDSFPANMGWSIMFLGIMTGLLCFIGFEGFEEIGRELYNRLGPDWTDHEHEKEKS